jgi:hypothetical protein
MGKIVVPFKNGIADILSHVYKVKYIIVFILYLIKEGE